MMKQMKKRALALLLALSILASLAPAALGSPSPAPSPRGRARSPKRDWSPVRTARPTPVRTANRRRATR